MYRLYWHLLMTLIRKILDLGTQQQSFSSANRTRTLNFISIFTTLVSGLYTLNYIFIIDNTLVAFINSLFTFAYLFTLFFSHKRAFKSGKIWFFSILMLHLFVCTNLYVTNESGFHLYYFLVPTGAFLLFELNEKLEKICLSALSVILFFYCENTFNSAPLITLSDTMNHAIYQSVIFINMVEAIIVMTIFANQIESHEKRLIHQATTDSLTNIANRRYFFDKGQTLLVESNKQDHALNVCLIDLDYFKKINDTYGHHIGDQCLISTCEVIKSLCQPNDLFARIGGEEFALIMPNISFEQAQIHANKIREAIANNVITTINNNPLSCTASFGLTTKVTNITTLKDLLSSADKALYQAKSTGRNQIRSY